MTTYEMQTNRKCPQCGADLVLVYYEYEEFERIECEECSYMEYEVG